MSFLHPEFLYYMLPPLFVLFGLLLTQKEAQGHFFSDEVMSKLRVSANTLTLKARNALFFLIGFLIIIALANPVIDDGIVKVKAKSADIMIALDISDSMLAQDVYPNRLKLAKQKAIKILKHAPNERVGVLAFAKNSYLVSPMSFDHTAVGFLLSKLNTDSITEQGTNLLSLLESVDKNIKTADKKYLLVLSDGGDKTNFTKEIAYAKEKKIVVFVLGVGTLKGVPIKLENGNFIKQNGKIIVSKLNENIANLATSSGGVYIQSVNSNDDVVAMLKEIKSKSKEKELKSEDIHKFIPLFYYPVGLALLILIIATSSMSKRKRLDMPAVFILFVFLFINPHAKAGLLDFMELKKAKEAYQTGDYNKSTKLYGKYAKQTKNANSYYNEANSLYKLKRYKQAVQTYKKATFNDKKSRAGNLANIGNAYVKQQSLQEAVKSYEESLKLNEDKEVRENLEAVKKALKKKKKKDSKKNKNSKDKKKNKKDSKKSDEDKKSDDKDKNDKKENSQKQKNRDKKSEDKKSDKEKENPNNKNNKENNETKPQKKKEDLKQLDKHEDNKTKEQKPSIPHADDNKDKMSEAEEVKWLKELNSKQNHTFMYKLNKNKKEENSNEKPW